MNIFDLLKWAGNALNLVKTLLAQLPASNYRVSVDGVGQPKATRTYAALTGTGTISFDYQYQDKGGSLHTIQGTAPVALGKTDAILFDGVKQTNESIAISTREGMRGFLNFYVALVLVFDYTDPGGKTHQVRFDVDIPSGLPSLSL